MESERNEKQRLSVTLSRHLPQTHYPKSARAGVVLTFVFVFCIVVHGIVQNQTRCGRTVDRGRRLPRGLP
jgi:hypothetical protein